MSANNLDGGDDTPAPTLTGRSGSTSLASANPRAEDPVLLAAGLEVGLGLDFDRSATGLVCQAAARLTTAQAAYDGSTDGREALNAAMTAMVTAVLGVRPIAVPPSPAGASTGSEPIVVAPARAAAAVVAEATAIATAAESLVAAERHATTVQAAKIAEAAVASAAATVAQAAEAARVARESADALLAHDVAVTAAATATDVQMRADDLAAKTSAAARQSASEFPQPRDAVAILAASRLAAQVAATATSTADETAAAARVVAHAVAAAAAALAAVAVATAAATELEVRQTAGAIQAVAEATARDIAQTSVIAERTARAAAFRDDETRFGALMSEVVEHAIIALDLDGVIQSWNAGAERLKGYTTEQAVGRNFSMFYTQQDREDGLPQRMLEQAREKGHVEHCGWRVRRDGATFWGDVVITAVHDARGALTGYAKVTRDLTDQHRLEVAQASLYAVVAHDLKTPIAVIRAYASLMDKADAATRAEYSTGIEANADQLARLIDELFDFAKVRTGGVAIALEPISPCVLARACADSLGPVLSNHLVQVEDSASLVMADRIAMERVLGNLLTNAAKYSPEGSLITITFENRNGRVRLAVTDQGRGIAPEDLDTIFGEFVRGRLANDDGGTGLGLASVRTLTGLQGGRVWIDSTLDHGTTVTVELQIAYAP